MKTIIEFLKKYHALITIMVVYAWALVSVALYRYAEEPPGTITLRLCHWQLEAGVRDGINKMAQEYQKLYPNVRVIQEAIPEGTYGQWLSTQIMSGTAPDLIEMGKVPYQVLIAYYNRYCYVLTPYVNKPNPYNKNNDFAETPLRNTFKDGMAAGYVNELQEYMMIPLSSFAVRVFYNSDLLEKLTGSRNPPENYREFFDICKKISKMTDENGNKYIPVVGSKYHFSMWESSLCNIMTYSLKDKADLNRDGYVGNDELFIAVKAGMISFKDRPIAARFQMIREISDFCQPGFTGLSRDEGVFLFSQKRAVFMATGTWDAMSLKEQTKGSFTLGIMDFPMPTQDDPVYGDVVAGPRYENPFVGFNYSVARTSKHPEVALDFLMFMASKENNEKLNQIIGWIPSVLNTEMDPFLRDFKPCFEGVYGCFEPNLGGETWIKWLQLTSMYQVNPKFTFEQFAEQYETFYKTRGYDDFMEQMKDRNRVIPSNERFLAGFRSQAMLAGKGSEDANSYWIKYRTQTRDRQVFHEIRFSTQMKYAKDGPPSTKDVGPYEYSMEVMETVKERVKGRK